MEIKIKRTDYLAKETLGKLTILNDKGKVVFDCFTLELPWKENWRKISCIPPRTYKFKTNPGQGNLSYPHYDVIGVVGRAGIKIHCGNYYTQILGCILVGKSLVDINNDKVKDVTSSHLTLTDLMKIAGDDGTLTIEK